MNKFYRFALFRVKVFRWITSLRESSLQDSTMLRGMTWLEATASSKLKHSNMEAPTELLLVIMEATIVHLLRLMSYSSTELREEDPSLPPRATRTPPQLTTSWVDLEFHQYIYINYVLQYFFFFFKCWSNYQTNRN